ncbi:MAG: hypothetical protein ACAH95_12330, partial [Fimbriimonas sp.]
MLTLIVCTALSLTGTPTGYAYGAGSGPAAGRPYQSNYWEAGPVQDLGEVMQLSCGYYHSVAVRQDGHVLTWGSNERSQLGLGTGSAKITALSTPTVVQNLPNSMAVAAGGTFTLA